jgi:hypothetical protein
MRISLPHVISTSDLLTFIVGGVISLISIGPSGSSFPPQAVSRLAAVHRDIAFATVDAVGAIVVIVFTLAGTTVEVVVLAIGNIVFKPIHAFVKTFPTALFVFSTNFLVLDECFLGSIVLIEFSCSSMVVYNYCSKM